MIKLVGYFLFITSFQRTLIVLSSKSLTLGQASRISGINPSDIAILAMRVK